MEATYPFSSFPTPNSTPTPTPTPTPTVLHIPPILPAVPQAAPIIKQPSHTFYLIAIYVILLGIFIYFARKIFRRRGENSDPVPRVDGGAVRPPPRRREGSCFFTVTHIALLHFVNSYTSALAGIALNYERFRIQFLPNYSFSIANHKNTNPICNFVDGRVLLLSTLYEFAGIVGLLLYIALSRKLSLRWIVLVAPSTHLIGAIMCYKSTTLWTLAMGRFFMGVAPGFTDQINDRLIKEFAPEDHKTKLQWCNLNLSNVGSIAAYSIAYYASSVHVNLRDLLSKYLIGPLFGFILICIGLATYNINTTVIITFQQLRRLRAQLPLRLKYQILVYALGLDVLIQYFPEYITFSNKSGDEGYLASLCVSIATAVSMVTASGLKLERFGRSVLSSVVFMVLLSVGVLHLMLDRLPSPISDLHQPSIVICVTTVYCALTGLSRIDLKMFEVPDDVQPTVFTLNRVVAAVVNVVILLLVSFLGCLLQLKIFMLFVVFIVFMYALCSANL